MWNISSGWKKRKKKKEKKKKKRNVKIEKNEGRNILIKRKLWIATHDKNEW